MRKLMAFSLLVVALFAIPAGAQAADGKAEDGLLFRVGGDVAVAADESVDTVIVINGNLAVAGTVGTAILIESDGRLTGADAETLVVINGTVDLTEGSTVQNDVVLVSSTLVRDESSTVEGEIVENFDRGLLIALWVLGLFLAVGMGILAIVAALFFAAIAPETARRATRAISKEIGPTLLAGLILFFGAPLVIIAFFVTIVGIPTAFAIGFAVYGIMGFLGYLVAGIWLGDLIISRGAGVGHPYLAAFIGMLLLAIASIIPVLGGLIGMIAAFLGGGALALLAWRSFRGKGGAAPTIEEATSPADAQ